MEVLLIWGFSLLLAYHSSCWASEQSKAGEMVALTDGVHKGTLLLHHLTPLGQPRLPCQLHLLLVQECTGGCDHLYRHVLEGDANWLKEDGRVEFRNTAGVVDC